MKINKGVVIGISLGGTAVTVLVIILVGRARQKRIMATFDKILASGVVDDGTGTGDVFTGLGGMTGAVNVWANSQHPAS